MNAYINTGAYQQTNSAEGETLKALFDAGWQLTKFRGMMFFSLACAAGSIWAGINLAQSHGLSPADGGVLAPLATRLAWGAGVSLLGTSFAVGMWLYGKCYVARIEFDERTGILHIYSVRFFGTKKHEFDASRVLSSRYHEGKLDLRVTVDAPWRSVRMQGRKLPLIIDEQGEFIDQELMSRLF